VSGLDPTRFGGNAVCPTTFEWPTVHSECLGRGQFGGLAVPVNLADRGFTGGSPTPFSEWPEQSTSPLDWPWGCLRSRRRFGALIGALAVCGFVVQNYWNLHID
jgi:hypothetical protein